MRLCVVNEYVVLGRVREFRYLGSQISEDLTSIREVKTRLAIATQQLSKFKKIWTSNTIRVKVKVNILRAVVLATALYGCESWTLTPNLEKRIEAFEMRCFRRLLSIPYTAHRTNESVCAEITTHIGQYEPLIEIVRRRKLQWFGHLARHPGTLAHTILQGYIDGKRKPGRPKTNWSQNIQTWTEQNITDCYGLAYDRVGWRELVRKAKTPLRLAATGQ